MPEVGSHPQAGYEHLDALVLLILSYGWVVCLQDRKAGITATQQLGSLHASVSRTLLSLVALTGFGRFQLAMHWQPQVHDFRHWIATVLC